jgi:hypothetical protein
MTRFLYQISLGLYPRDYRINFGEEMLAAFGYAAQACGGRARFGFALFVSKELAALWKGAAAEWVAKRTTNTSRRWRCLPDLMTMRPPGISRECWYAAAARADSHREPE